MKNLSYTPYMHIIKFILIILITCQLIGSKYNSTGQQKERKRERERERGGGEKHNDSTY